MRGTLAAILAEKGYTVAEAATGEQALDLCQQQAFDVVLMDVRMPGLNGVETFRKIRRYQDGTKVILMSTYHVDDLKRTALEEGAVAFLPKPLNVQRIMDLIQDVNKTAILVIQNDQDEGEGLQAKLRDGGCQVTVASTPQDALELMEQIRFNIVLIEDVFPAMTGLELYLAIKQITPTTLAIMLSGQNEKLVKIALQGIQQTAYTILQKPIDQDHLLDLFTGMSAPQASKTINKLQPS